MLRKAVTYFLFALSIGALVAFIRFSEILRKRSADKELCTAIQVEILDSLDNRLVSQESVCEMICRLGNPIGLKISEVDVYHLEKGINGMGAIKNADVAIDRAGLLHVFITQRHPILRFQNKGQGYYMDDTGFCFPLSDLFTSDVPIVSGEVRADDNPWIEGMLEMGIYLDGHPFWHTQIEQINVLSDGTLNMWSRTSDQVIRFGLPKEIETKFDKLLSFYQNVAPTYGWEYYSAVNLSYKDQIVCTRSDNNNTLK